MEKELKEEVIRFVEACLRGVFIDDDFLYGNTCSFCSGIQYANDSQPMNHDESCEAMLLYKKLTNLE